MHPLLSIAAASAALLLAASAASASAEPSGRFVRVPQPGNGGFHFAVPFYWPVERETVYIEREVIREVPAEPAPPPPAPPPPPREPFVVGKSYASLPGGCMKMIEEGQSFYYCGGTEWYRQLGAKSYKAVLPR